MSIARRPRFLDGPGGPIFLLELAPERAGGEEAAIVVPPFAEEMNRCRRMMTLLGERLAERGVRCLLFDFRGTGESAGEFADTRLAAWREDVAAVRAHALATGARRLHWVGIRFGALLASEAAAGEGASLLLWEPATSGRQVVNQFVRLEAAAQLIARAGGGRPAAERAGEAGPREIAGYLLTDELKGELETLSLDASWPKLRCPVAWFEMGSREGQELTPVGRRYLAALREPDERTRGASIPGPAFWSTTEIAVSPELLAASCAFIVG